MKTHNLLLSSVAALALTGTMAFAQVDADLEREAGIRLETSMTDADGRMVDAEGRFIDAEGYFADAEGIRLETDSEPLMSQNLSVAEGTVDAGALGGQVVVEQADATVDVQVPDPS